MLAYLSAKNLGLIREAELHPGPGFTVITGETGAGKTLLLGALRLLLGETADAGVVGPFASEARAEGIFGRDEDFPVSRVVPGGGRSRAYRDGVIVSADSLRVELSERIQIVGQHDQFQLKRPAYVMDLLDQNLDNAGRETLDVYRTAWEILNQKLKEQAELGGSQQELARELDLARYQSEEISRASFSEGEDSSLEQKSLRLRNIEEIREHLASSGQLLDELVDQAGEVVSHLRKVSSLDPTASSLEEVAESLAITMAELNRELGSGYEALAEDPEALEEIDRRLTLLGDLKMKYGRSIDEINDFGLSAAKRAEDLASLLKRATSIDGEVNSASQESAARANELSQARRRVAARIEAKIVDHLEEVGLGEARVSFEFEHVELGARGSDRVRIHFSSHDRLQPGPIEKVASGGELSRLILAISLATGSEDLTTLVFDEVDAGVGGATALAMGRKLADLASRHQVLCVTHLPQVAAFADLHYVISRDDEEAIVTPISGPDRLAELSRMIAGLPESDRGQQAAAELLELTGK